MIKDYIIVGARGFGREIYAYLDFINHNDIKFKGFLDTDQNALKKYNIELPILASPFDYVPDSNDYFIVALGNPSHRFAYSANLLKQRANFLTYSHPSSTIGARTTIGAGSFICARVGISVDIKIGSFTFIQELTIIGHDVVIGDWCQINGSCVIEGGARIGNFVTIHANSVINSSAVIGDYSVVGAGSVVYGRIPENITVMGNPARKFKFK
jgi:sugar O-acyltransferase (sialic acid O-acetyltransferase NeuD family)